MMRFIAIEAVELFGNLDSRGIPAGGSRAVRCILTVDESGQVVGARLDNEGYLEHQASTTAATPAPAQDVPPRQVFRAVPARELLRTWLEQQKAEGTMSEEAAGLIWLLAIEVDTETLWRLARPVIHATERAPI